jgi:hypothetical protein
MKNIKYFSLIAVASLFWQCEPSVDEFQPSKGTADFTTFVSVGDSYSAGYVDGALGYSGQMVSFPNMIANQLKSVGMVGEFKQPLTTEGKSVGTTVVDADGNLNGYFKLKVVDAAGTLSPVPTPGDKTILSTWIGDQAPFRNVGVPGAKTFHLLTPVFGNYTLGTGNYNPFYSRFASTPGTSTVFGDAMANNPTFASIWIGGNDVLLFALAGGEGTVGGLGANDITDLTTFTNSIGYLFSTLKNAGIEGVTGNIPDINSLPYFTTVPYNALLLTAAQATTLNGAYAAYNTNAASNGLPQISFVEGYNGLVVYDKLGYLRHAVSTDRILLPAGSKIKSAQWGSAVPIGKEYVLDANEITNITTYTNNFNNVIKSQADANNLAFVDLKALMADIVDQKVIDGVTYSSTFVKGNTFSLDGIHATPRGSAVIANEFIKAINAKYNASVPMVNINDYRVNVFPEVE